MRTHIHFGRTVLGAAALLATVAGASSSVAQRGSARPAVQVRSVAMPRAGFVVTSRDLASGASFTRRQEAAGSGCTGENLSPALAWRGAPAGTRSFAVTMFDPDAPTGSGFWHWIVYDIPAAVTSLPSGAGRDGAALPAGAVQGVTDLGAPGYAGACPPRGDGSHRYILTVHALKTEHVDVPEGATAAVIRFILHSQTIATASVTAHYALPAARGGRTR